RRVGVNHLHALAFDDHDVIVVLDINHALERTMHGIEAQQAGTLVQVIATLAATHYDGTQPHAAAAARALTEQTRDQTADTAEAEQHHVLGCGQCARVHV